MRGQDRHVYRCQCGAWVYRGRDCSVCAKLSDRVLSVVAGFGAVVFWAGFLACLALWWAPA